MLTLSTKTTPITYFFTLVSPFPDRKLAEDIRSSYTIQYAYHKIEMRAREMPMGNMLIFLCYMNTNHVKMAENCLTRRHISRKKWSCLHDTDFLVDKPVLYEYIEAETDNYRLDL